MYGGRWNLPGTRMVYCSQSLALATLEVLVNLPSISPLQQYVSISVEFDERLCVILAGDDLPDDWAAKPPSRSSQLLGTAWTESARSLILAVPSAVIASERNYLINPSHPEFPSLDIGEPTAFPFDSRLSGQAP